MLAKNLDLFEHKSTNFDSYEATFIASNFSGPDDFTYSRTNREALSTAYTDR